MFESPGSHSAAADLPSAVLAEWVERVGVIGTGGSDAELIDQIAQLERLKSACAAAQAALSVAFVASRTAGLTEKEIKDERVHRSIAAQVALARRDSPFRGGRHVGLAKALVREMPNTYAALRAGEISEWRATLLVRETACLTVADRQQVDAELAGKLGGMGDRQTAAAAMRIAQKLDPKAWVERHRKAVSERRVSIRPAPDLMGYVSALLPVAKAVAVYAALNQYANTATAVGDDRSRGQLMADEFVHRVTNPQATAATTPAVPRNSSSASATGGSPTKPTPNSHAEGADTKNAPTDPGGAAFRRTGVRDTDNDVDPETLDDEDDAADSGAGGSVPPGVGIDIQLIMTDRTLFDGDDEPAIITGYGPIPAPIARDLIRNANPDTKTWIRRLYTDPDTGHLVNADSRRRTFPHAMRQYLLARDQYCRTPWCDAPIRHTDHITAHSRGGTTTITNGQGICENCNYVKESPGWTSTAEPDGYTITINTPTGHTFSSEPPPPPQSIHWIEQSVIEERLYRWLLAS